MGHIANHLGTVVRIVYVILIFLEIFSTFVADVYGVALQLKQHLRIGPKLLSLILLLVCYLTSQFGFSSLLSVLYPLFGLFSLIWVIMLVRHRNERTN
ncbi:hypothetical protein D3C72_838210 [compost metagenome]